MGQLFDKPLPELREAFVRARFAEPNIFGREDIEEWLDGTRYPMLSVDNGNAWRAKFFGDYSTVTWDAPDSMYEVMGRMIDEHATPKREPSDWYLHGCWYRADHVRLIDLLASSGIKVYYPGRRGPNRVPILRIGRDTFAVDPLDADESSKFARFASMRRAKVSEFFDLLLDEYLLGRPKATQALMFLKEQYVKAIRHVRASAERDFDEAVAVSADGTKIVKANEVVVMGKAVDGSQDLVFQASAFRDQKILRTKLPDGYEFRHLPQIGKFTQYEFKIELQYPDLHRGGPSHSLKSFFDCRVEAHYTHEVGRWWHGSLYSKATLIARLNPPAQNLVCVTDGRVFIAHPDDCPSPLPEGGREIQV